MADPESAKAKNQTLAKLQWKHYFQRSYTNRAVLVGVIGITVIISGAIGVWNHGTLTSADSGLTTYSPLPTQIVLEAETKSPVSDINAEMLVGIPDRVPSPYLVPPPFPPPYKVLIKRKEAASRRYYQEPLQFSYAPKRLPVNSIQDILNQMERDSMDFDRHSYKKPKRINFYGRYRHRPNRPKVVPIKYGEYDAVSPSPPMRNSNPSVAYDVNHLTAPNTVPQRDQSQLFYPKPIASHSTTQSTGLYEQIIATNKHRQETAKDARPFSLMLDIYPLSDDNSTKILTTLPPPLSPPQLPPLQIDHSYYNRMKFPQIHPTYNPDHYSSVSESENSNDQPGKMVVHLNLYPTKKKNIKNSEPFSQMTFFTGQDEDTFMPIVNPQVLYRSRVSDDNNNERVLKTVQFKPPMIQPPQQYVPNQSQSHRRHSQIGIPRVNIIKPSILGPPINITDYRTTIAPQTINTFLLGDGPPRLSYLGHFNSNEIGRRIDDQLQVSTKSESSVIQRNSHQPENPMVVENLSSYLRSVNTKEPSRKDVSS